MSLNLMRPSIRTKNTEIKIEISIVVRWKKSKIVRKRIESKIMKQKITIKMH